MFNWKISNFELIAQTFREVFSLNLTWNIEIIMCLLAGLNFISYTFYH